MFKSNSEYSFNCSNNFESLAQNVGIHMTNYLKNPYSPNDHWGYSWMGNSGTPTQDGRTYYYTNNKRISRFARNDKENFFVSFITAVISTSAARRNPLIKKRVVCRLG